MDYDNTGILHMFNHRFQQFWRLLITHCMQPGVLNYCMCNALYPTHYDTIYECMQIVFLSLTVHRTCTISFTTLSTTMSRDTQQKIQTLVTVILSAHITAWCYCYTRFCPSVCLSVCLSHCWSTPNGSRYWNMFQSHNACSFLASNFIAVSFLCSQRMSELNRGTPLSKAIIWPILYDNSETVWDRMLIQHH